ncbi:MAG TPA: DUF2161 family putative PD-(D/E)XK-type phosphodiesterase [Aestuariivirga sp.]|jgi:hypothetical protein|nr:DUF2161 family putative PD-(D/E)XK-type phosphodiesterase [Aestuariivirga sp.]
MILPETDLYLPVKRFLEAQGYDVKGEIGDCDVLAVRGNEPPVIVELKTGFNLQLLLQGIDRQTVTDSVYLAIPEPKRPLPQDILRLCKRLGLGLLVVDRDWVEAYLDPAPYQPRKAPRRKAVLLKEFQRRVGDYNSGGSSRRPLVTAYRQDALRCVKFLKNTGASKVSDIVAQTKVERAAGILQRDPYGWFVREDRGIYFLSPKGEAAVTMFADVLAAV